MIQNIKKTMAALGASLLAFGLTAATANAAPPNYTLFGDAAIVQPGNASDNALQLVSDNDPGWGSIEFDVADGTTFANLATLSTDFNVTNDDCINGSPRFQVEVTTPDGPKNIFVYLGPAPGYTDCPENTWVSSGDLLEAGLTIDTSQLTGGTFYDAYADALAEFGAYPITNLSLVTDAGYAFTDDGEQTVLFDNVMINNEVVTFEPEVVMPISKDECKKGGWQNFGIFKNQGDCVSFVATGGNNPGAIAQ